MNTLSSYISRAALVLPLAVLMAFMAPGSVAQVLYGTLVGTVTDPSGAAVAGAEVTVANQGTGQVRIVTSQADGSYNAPNLQGGDYTLEVKLGGFKTAKRTSIQVVVNSIRREDFSLEVGDVTEAITVEGSAMALQTEKADVSSEISASTVNNLPIGGYRNYQSLINLVPGATPAAFQNAAITRPGRALTTNVNGTNRNNNVTKLDGAVNISTWLPHHVAYVAPSETIETVNITTNNFDAEQGLAGGAAVTVVTKSGTNDLHGSLYGYHDNQHLRAWG
ncbi:MAG: carboxypeptidase regulatory-like domain-containing protein, partial [Bryobacterales bacterium]|nr:carboxypeptidase regulatory-like domain-containing protein [Bryobacterales bacterium]